MIPAESFLIAARNLGYNWYCGVPCSFLSPLISALVKSDATSYVASTNEGDAVAAAAGAVLGGRGGIVLMQNSGLGNAVNPLTSLTGLFGIPLMLLVSLRGQPGIADEPQHTLMGEITERMLTLMGIRWEYFPTEEFQLAAVLARAVSTMRSLSQPYALIVRRNSLVGDSLCDKGRSPLLTSIDHSSPHIEPHSGLLPLREEVLKLLVALSPQNSTVVIATTGFTSRQLLAIADRPNHFYMVGSMGCAASFGLGLSLARPRLRVVVVDGDGACLMRMGNMATIGAYAAPNLIHLLLDNRVYESTGGQDSVASRVDFAQIARACGYAKAFEGNTLSVVEAAMTCNHSSGPTFARVRIRSGAPDRLPRPRWTPPELWERVKDHIRDIDTRADDLNSPTASIVERKS